MERREENGTFSVEDEMRDLVSSAMEGVGYKQPEGKKKRSGHSREASGSASGTQNATGDASGNDVQQFGSMQVVT